MKIERRLGFKPFDREFEKLGYDIESRVPNSGRLRFIEVKGRDAGAETVTVTRNEILWPSSIDPQRQRACREELAGKKKRPLRGVGPAILSLAGCRES